MKHFKLISKLVALSIAISTLLPITVFADTNTEERKLINVSPINEDDDFPLYADIEFSESSIHFIDVDCYECEYGVDKSRLESSIILRAKENDTEFEISLCSNETGYEESFVSADSELSISGLEYDTYYEFSLDYSGKNYIGSIGMIFEACNMVYLDLFYLRNEFNDEIQTYANIGFQHEGTDETKINNDTFEDADDIVLGQTVNAKVDKNYDIDYYYIGNLMSSDYNGTAFTNGNLQIVFNSNNNPSVSLKIELYAKRGDNYKKIGSGIPTINGCQFIAYQNSNGDKQFYICVKSLKSTGTAKIPYYFNVNYNASRPFYSQKVGKIHGINLWNTQYLDKLTFPNYSNKKFITTDDTNDYDVMKSGCALASYAMVLRNVNATMGGKDFRTGFTGSLYADPFTAMLSNIGSNGSELKNLSANTLSNSEPDYLWREKLVSNFKINGKTLYSHRIQVGNMTESKKMECLDAVLNLNGQYKAIISFKNKNSCTHFMVVTGYNRNEIDAKNRYIVLDPLGTTFSQAKGLKFGLCPIYKMENAWHMEFDDMVTIDYINQNSADFQIG